VDVELQKGCRIGAWFFGGVSAVGKVWLVIWLTCHSMLFFDGRILGSSNRLPFGHHEFCWR